MRQDLEKYVNNKPSFEYLEHTSQSYIKYKKGDVLIPPNNHYQYIILGFLVYHTGYLRYVGELINLLSGSSRITSRDIKEVQKEFKLSISHILKKL